MGGQCYLAPRFKALNSCQLDRDLGLMRMTASAGQVRPCDRARGTRSVAGSFVGDKDETSGPLLTAEHGTEKRLLEGLQSRQTFCLCWTGRLVCRWMDAQVCRGVCLCKRKKMRQVESGGVVNKAFA